MGQKLSLNKLKLFVLVIALVFFSFGISLAETVSSYEASIVAQNWLNSCVKSYGSWAGSNSPTIVEQQIVEYENKLVGYNFIVSPSGHVLVPAMHELPVVKLYSETCSLSIAPSDADQVAEWIAEELYKIDQAIEEHRDELEMVDLSQTKNGKLWALFSAPAAEFAQEYADYESGVEFLTVGPLLTTTWKQGDPYNLQCPLYYGSTTCRTVVGCVATAAAQIMKYWNYPAKGAGSTSYTWYNGSTNVTLSRNFSSSTYDWSNMPNSISGSSSTTQKNAVAKLCGDVGVAFHMNYGCGVSAASTMYGTTVYPTYFGYKSTIDDAYRTDYASDSAWMKVFKTECQAGRPSQFRMRDPNEGGHSVVVDGYRDSPEQIHINMGWGGSYDGWYVSNNINTGSYHWSDVNYQGAVIGIQPSGGGASSAQVTSLWPVYGANCGETSRLWAQVNNNGSVNLPSAADVWYWVDGPSWSGDHYVGHTSVSGLTPGSTSWYYNDWSIPSTRASGTHTYWARVWDSSSGTWLGAWKGPQTFVVSCGGGGFNSQFKGSADGWESHWGDWAVSGDEWYHSPGVSNTWSTATYTESYTNCDYRLRFWREENNYHSNRILVRATPEPLGSSNKNLYSYYSFQYVRDGKYSVWKRVSGSSTCLQSWTSSSAINGTGWNELRVVASGSNLYYYINGTLVWSGSDSSLSSGRAGLGMHDSGNAWVDWATLTTSSSGLAITDEVSEEQQALNDAAREGEGGSEEQCLLAAELLFYGGDQRIKGEDAADSEGMMEGPPGFEEMMMEGPPDADMLQEKGPFSMDQGEGN